MSGDCTECYTSAAPQSAHPAPGALRTHAEKYDTFGIKVRHFSKIIPHFPIKSPAELSHTEYSLLRCAKTFYRCPSNTINYWHYRKLQFVKSLRHATAWKAYHQTSPASNAPNYRICETDFRKLPFI